MKATPASALTALNGQNPVSTVARLIAALLSLWALLGSAHTVAARIATFAPEIEVAGETLPLRGSSTYRWTFFKLYDAALYLPSDVAPEEVFEPVAKRLEIAYAREIPVEKMVEAGNRIVANNCPPEVLARIADGLDQINQAYVTPDKGDRYTLTFIPGVGTELAFNGEVATIIEGDAFASCYFRIWLGERPVSGSFRDELLGVR